MTADDDDHPDPLIAWHMAAAAAGAQVVTLEWDKIGPRSARWLYRGTWPARHDLGRVGMAAMWLVGGTLSLHPAWWHPRAPEACVNASLSGPWKCTTVGVVYCHVYTVRFDKLHAAVDALLNHLAWFKSPGHPEWWLYRMLTNGWVPRKTWRKAAAKVQPHPEWPRHADAPPHQAVTFNETRHP